MDWEIHERFRATLLLLGVMTFSLLMLFFQRSPVVRSFRAVLLYAMAPVHGAFSQWQTPATVTPLIEDAALPPEAPEVSVTRLVSPRLQSLLDENERLRALLALKERNWPKAVPASVIGRDPRRWFQELVIDKGSSQGVVIDDPVVASLGESIGLVGRIIEVHETSSRVMLLQDSLSAIAATVAGRETDDGVVEGSDGRTLMLKYLDRHSPIQVGDWVVTSGLGQRFPAGVLIGVVLDLELDPRQLFIQARLRPAVQGRTLHWVMVLTDSAFKSPS